MFRLTFEIRPDGSGKPAVKLHTQIIRHVELINVERNYSVLIGMDLGCVFLLMIWVKEFPRCWNACQISPNFLLAKRIR